MSYENSQAGDLVNSYRTVNNQIAAIINKLDANHSEHGMSLISEKGFTSLDDLNW